MLSFVNSGSVWVPSSVIPVGTIVKSNASYNLILKTGTYTSVYVDDIDLDYKTRPFDIDYYELFSTSFDGETKFQHVTVGQFFVYDNMLLTKTNDNSAVRHGHFTPHHEIEQWKFNDQAVVRVQIIPEELINKLLKSRYVAHEHLIKKEEVMKDKKIIARIDTPNPNEFRISKKTWKLNAEDIPNGTVLVYGYKLNDNTLVSPSGDRLPLIPNNEVSIAIESFDNEKTFGEIPRNTLFIDGDKLYLKHEPNPEMYYTTATNLEDAACAYFGHASNIFIQSRVMIPDLVNDVTKKEESTEQVKEEVQTNGYILQTQKDKNNNISWLLDLKHIPVGTAITATGVNDNPQLHNKRFCYKISTSAGLSYPQIDSTDTSFTLWSSVYWVFSSKFIYTCKFKYVKENELFVIGGELYQKRSKSPNCKPIKDDESVIRLSVIRLSTGIECHIDMDTTVNVHPLPQEVLKYMRSLRLEDMKTNSNTLNLLDVNPTTSETSNKPVDNTPHKINVPQNLDAEVTKLKLLMESMSKELKELKEANKSSTDKTLPFVALIYNHDGPTLVVTLNLYDARDKICDMFNEFGFPSKIYYSDSKGTPVIPEYKIGLFRSTTSGNSLTLTLAKINK